MPFRRATRLLLRVAGWLLTPLILICAATIGASIGLVAASQLPLKIGLIVTVLFALTAAVAVLVLWVRLLRQRPGLREVLDITPEGLPESHLVQDLVRPEKT